MLRGKLERSERVVNGRWLKDDTRGAGSRPAGDNCAEIPSKKRLMGAKLNGQVEVRDGHQAPGERG